MKKIVIMLVLMLIMAGTVKPARVEAAATSMVAPAKVEAAASRPAEPAKVEAAASRPAEPAKVEAAASRPAEPVKMSAATSKTVETLSSENIVWSDTPIEEKQDGLTFRAYLSEDKQAAWIYEVNTKSESLSELRFPETIQGAAVVRIGKEGMEDYFWNVFGQGVEPYHDVDGYAGVPKGIKTVSLPDSVSEILPCAFCGFRDLEEITIPDSVKVLEYSLFYGCQSLQSVSLPSSLEVLNLNVFAKCNSLGSISMGKEGTTCLCEDGLLLSKDRKELVWVVPAMENVVIPDGVQSIRTRCFSESLAKKVSIPKSVEKIEYSAMRGEKISKIVVDAANESFGISGDCLYSKKNHQLVVGICKKGILKIDKKVTCLKKDMSIAGASVKELKLPATLKQFGKNWYQYAGLNAGVKVYFTSKKPPKVGTDRKYFLPFAKYYVPKGSLKTYQSWYTKAKGKYVELKEYTA